MGKTKITRYTASNSANQNERIDHDLKQLGLEGMRSCFRELANKNIVQNKTPKDYLESLLEYQRHEKERLRIQARINQAKFGEEKTLGSFEFNLLPNLNKRLVLDLASCTFIDEGKNVFLIGQSGLGKTHIAKGVGREAIYKGHDIRFVELLFIVEDLMYKYRDVDSQRRFLTSLQRPKLLILDEIKFYETTPNIRDFLYRLLRHRYEERKATIFTSNIDVPLWAPLFGDDAEMILDRILDQERKIIVHFQGPSGRVPDLNQAMATVSV